MRWRKEPKDEHKHPGRASALDGLTAAHRVESTASDVVLIESSPVFGELGERAGQNDPQVSQPTPDARHAIAAASGLAATGGRAGIFVDSIAGAREAIAAAAGKHLPLVVHLVGRAMARHATSMNASHDYYHAAADAGCFSFYASNPQQVSDFAAIARWVAERSLTPGICAHDLFETSHSVQDLFAPSADFIHEYLGRPGDIIEAPTPAQRILFGETRRRVPRLLDADRPAGIGGTQDRDSYVKGVAAGQMFFASHLDALVDEGMEAFAERTGRFHGKVSSYCVEDAEFVVVAQGSIVDDLRAVVDYMRKREKFKVGVIGVHVFRPFPGAEITRLLKNKRVVTVLERTEAPLSEDRPMLAQICAAVDKALDNHAAKAAQPYSDYAAFAAGDKPQFLTGAYGIGGGNPSFAELVAVYRNMFSSEARHSEFYMSANLAPDTSRFPHLETLSQQLQRAYPDLAKIALPAADDVRLPARVGDSVQLHALSIQGALAAMNVAAQTLAADLGHHVKTMPEGGLEPSLQPARLTLSFAAADGPAIGRPTSVGAALVLGEGLLADLPSSASLEQGGTVIVETNQDAAALWKTLPAHLTRWMREKELRLFAIDARRVATETASQSSAIDQLAVWALLGAWIDKCTHQSQLDLANFSDHLAQRISTSFGADHALVHEITEALQRGAQDVVEVERVVVSDAVAPEQVEAPWTVQQIDGADNTVFDPARFWRSVGYLYDTGQDDKTLADPYLATGVMPAGSSAFRDLTAYRIRIPSWLPENCTGCGDCWAQCPESALPPTVQSAAAVIETAMAACESDGQSMVQMNRIADHLGKQATRLVGKGGPHPYTSAAELLDVAFTELVARMNLEGDALNTVTTEFGAVRDRVGALPIAQTEVFFDAPNQSEKGSGTLLSIALNPMSCTACGVCIEACADGALEWVEQQPQQVAELRTTWDFHRSLPAVANDIIERHLTRDAETHVNRLLDKRAYHSMVGGDGSMPGSGVKTAVHLITASVESVMLPRFAAHIDTLTNLIERIEKKIQGEIADAVEINDFEAFGQKLRNLERGAIKPDHLVDLAGEGGSASTIDGDELRVLSDLLHDIKEQRERYREGAAGTGRARMMLAIDTDDGSFWHGTYPYNPHRHPWIRQVAGDASALSEGVFLGMASKLADEFAACRRAELELDDAYVAGEHDAFFKRFDWTEFNDAEWQLVPPVIVVGSPATTAMRRLSKLLARNCPIKFAVINTDGLPAAGAEGTELTRFGLAQRRAFVVQSSTGHPGHLMRGVAEAIECQGPALLHVYAADPQRSGIAADRAAEQARLAYESRAWPLFTFAPQKPSAALELDGNPDAHELWMGTDIEISGRPGDAAAVPVSLTPAHWAVHEGRFQQHFQLMSRGHLDDTMKPLAEYLALDTEARVGFKPFVDVADKDGRHAIALVGQAMVAAADEAALMWDELRQVDTGVAAEVIMPVATPMQAEPPAPVAGVVDPVVYQRVADRLLQLCGYSDDPEFFQQSLREFVTRKAESNK